MPGKDIENPAFTGNVLAKSLSFVSYYEKD